MDRTFLVISNLHECLSKYMTTQEVYIHPDACRAVNVVSVVQRTRSEVKCTCSYYIYIYYILYYIYIKLTVKQAKKRNVPCISPGDLATTFNTSRMLHHRSVGHPLNEMNFSAFMSAKSSPDRTYDTSITTTCCCAQGYQLCR